MNIAVNARVLLKHRMEGVCRYIYETTRAMAEAHPEDTFYLFFDRPYDEFFITSDNVVPVVIPPPTRHPILWHIWFEWMVPRYLKKYDIDVFYSGDTYLSMKTQCPTLLVSHDLAYLHYPEHLPKRVLKYYTKNFPRFHKKAGHIVAVSQYTKDDICKQYGLDASNISVGYNACPAGFAPKSEEEVKDIRDKYAQGAPYFVYVGSFHPRKNVANLIRAFEHFKQSDDTGSKLLLIGRMAWNNEDLVQLYESSNYKEDVVLLGPMFDEVKDIVPASTALVYVSLFEGFGIPILEGWSSGVPVITSSVSSMKEVAGDAALTVDPLSPEDIAKAMETLSLDPQLRSRLVREGKERLAIFDWNQTAEMIYRELCKLKDIGESPV